MLHVLHHSRETVFDHKTVGSVLANDMSETDQILINQLISQLEKITNDHETRIRFLERAIGFGIGALAVIKFFLDAVMK